MLLATALATALAAAPDAGAAPSWERLADGVELATVLLDPHPVFGDGQMQVVRIDPEKAQLEFALASAGGGGKQTAGRWADDRHFVATLNAGMFDTDQKSNVGRLVDGAHENNPRWHPDYQSVLAFGPKKKGIAAAVFLDLDVPGSRERLADYRSVVQNLRLLRGGAQSVWKPNGRKWSEAAIAVDTRGQVLFLFARSPIEMSAFNARLQQLPLGITRAMHVEGGPEASLSVRAPGRRLDFCGSYETRFLEHDRNTAQWPIPNVLGVVAR